MKNYRKWSKKCEEWNSYEKAKEDIEKLNNDDIKELMEVAKFISSNNVYTIVPIIFAVCAKITIFFGDSWLDTIGEIIEIVALGWLVFVYFKNRKMMQGASFVHSAIYERINNMKGEAS